MEPMHRRVTELERENAALRQQLERFTLPVSVNHSV